MDDSFDNYERTKSYWFLLYMYLASMISEYPRYSAKNSDLLAEYVSQAYIEMLKQRGIYTNGQNDTS